MDVFKYIFPIINLHDFYETAYIGLQMFRQFTDEPFHYYYTCYYKTNQRLEQIELLAKSKIKKNYRSQDNGRQGNHDTVMQSLTEFLPKNAKPYVMLTYVDHWFVDFERFKPHLQKMIEENFDGWNFHTWIRKKVLGTSILIMKAEYYKRFENSIMFWRNLSKDALWEIYFLAAFGDLNWYIPTGDRLFSQYGYKKDFGYAHVHTFLEKVTLIRLWEHHHKKILDVNLRWLEPEHIPLNTEPFPQQLPLLTLDDETSENTNNYPWGAP